MDRCIELFSRISERPRGKLLLSFRKEFLPEVETLLERRGLAFTRFFVEPMGRTSVSEVVLGPTGTERLRRHFRLSIEPGLERSIAERVCADPGAPIAPTLQIFLTRLWSAALARDTDTPFFDRVLLDTIEERDDYLADFLDRQINLLKLTYSEEEASGLLLDLLAFHTSAEGYAQQRTRSEIRGRYSHIDVEKVDALVNSLISARLLSDLVSAGPEGIPGKGRSRLVHDTLAPRVRGQFDRSTRPGQRARRILEARVQAGMSPTTSHWTIAAR